MLRRARSWKSAARPSRASLSARGRCAPAQARGGGVSFPCQHKTRETVWIPELMNHANGAKRLRQVLIVSPEPAKDAAHLSKMIDRDGKTEADGAIAVPSGSDRADFVFLTREQLGKRYP